MDELRKQIDEYDNQIMTALDKRYDLVKQVAAYKQAHGLPVLQFDRMTQLVERLKAEYGSQNLSGEFIEQLYDLIMHHAIELENETMDD